MTIINKNELSSSTKTSISTMFAKHYQALWDHSMQPDLLTDLGVLPTSDGAENVLKSPARADDPTGCILQEPQEWLAAKIWLPVINF